MQGEGMPFAIRKGSPLIQSGIIDKIESHQLCSHKFRFLYFELRLRLASSTPAHAPWPRGSNHNREGVTDFASEPIYQIPEDQCANCVGTLEGTVYCAKLLIGPVQLVIEDPLEQGQNLPVHVIDGSGKEQRPTSEPSVAPDGWDGSFGVSFQIL